MMSSSRERSRRYLVFSNAIWILLFVLAVSPLWAHKIGESYIYFRVYEDKLSGDFHITLGDLNNALGIESPDRKITGDNIGNRLSEVHSYYSEKVHIFDGDTRLPLRFSDVDMMTVSEDSSHPGNYVVLEFVLVEDVSVPDRIAIDYNVLFDKIPDHVALVAIEYYWRAGIFDNESQMSLVLSPEDRRQELSLTKYSIYRGLASVIKLGIKHIWEGIDHILFITVLVLPAAMIRKKSGWHPVDEFGPALFYVIKIITLFAIAHSITLSIAALGIFTLPTRLVESVIAISIAAAALVILTPNFTRKIGWVVLIFGLFHGFSFANDLSHLGVLSEHIALSIFGFNLGLEIGQVVIVAIIFPFIYFFRTNGFYPRIVLRYGAVVLIFVSIFWFFDRAFLDIDVRGFIKKSVTTMVN